MSEIKDILYSEEEKWNMEVPHASVAKEQMRSLEIVELGSIVRQAIQNMIKNHLREIKIETKNFSAFAVEKFIKRLKEKGYSAYSTTSVDMFASPNAMHISIRNYDYDVPELPF